MMQKKDAFVPCRMTDRQTSKQDHAISYIRMIAMVMIVACHFCQFYGNELAYWLNVGVQIFFAVSGFLYGAKDIDDPVSFIGKQFKKILVPYFSFLLPVTLLYLVFARESFSVTSFVKAVFCVGTMEGLGHLWFIGYILFCYLITPYLFWLRKKAEGLSPFRMTLVYIALLLGVVILGTLLDSYFHPARICCYLIGFILSAYSKRFGKSALKWMSLLFGIPALAINAARIFIKYFRCPAKGTLAYKLFFASEPYMHLLLGIALFLILYLLLKKAKPCALVRFSDKYSFTIYIVHLLFIISPFRTMDLTPLWPLSWLLTVALIVLGGVLLHIVSTFLSKNVFTKEIKH